MGHAIEFFKMHLGLLGINVQVHILFDDLGRDHRLVRFILNRSYL